MDKRIVCSWLLTGALVASIGCGDDDTLPDGVDASEVEDAGRDSAQPDSGRSDAAIDASPDASEAEDDADAEDAGSDAGDDAGDDAGVGPRLLVGLTDYSKQTEITIFDLAANTRLGSRLYPDGDTVPVASEGYAFVLERKNGMLHLLDEQGEPTSLSLEEGGVTYQNPNDVVVIPNTDKAFVPLYNTSKVAVLDLDPLRVVSRIDLNDFVDPRDTDSQVEVNSGFYLPSTGLVYFTLQRITISGVNVVCTGTPSQLLGIDPTTASVVDINGAAPGRAIDLQLVNPVDITWDTKNQRLLLLAAGCTTAGVRQGHGIEALTLPVGASSIVYTPANGDFLSSFSVVSGSSAIYASYDSNFALIRYMFDRDTQTLGSVLTTAPEGFVVEAENTLLGVQTTASGVTPFSYSVVRGVLDTTKPAPVLTNSVLVNNTMADATVPFVSGVALVR